jgi:peptidoglycan/xylan/chitin deacetylase (PgdA/CDA1 family)
MGLKASYMSPLSPVGIVSVTFDNLGEAAELEMGALPADAELGKHPSATEVVPALLERLAEREIAATFFVEGMNAELYPELLREIAARGHEVAYHAWRHEQWGELSAAGQAENLARGIAEFERIGIEIAGLRPPGGRLGPGGVGVLREAGLRYCSPAGAGAGVEDGVALLPFEWRHIDAACVLPPLAAARERMTGSPDPVEPAIFVASLTAEIERLAEDGGFLAIVLHPFMLEWLGTENLTALLDRIVSARDDGLRAARCVDVAGEALADPNRFAGGTVLDATSWA